MLPKSERVYYEDNRYHSSTLHVGARQDRGVKT